MFFHNILDISRGEYFKEGEFDLKKKYFLILLIISLIISICNNSLVLARQRVKPNINSSEKEIDEYFKNNGIKDRTLKRLSLKEKREVLDTYVHPLDKLGITEKELDRRLLSRGFSKEELKKISVMTKALYYNPYRLKSVNSSFVSKNIKAKIDDKEEDINSYFLEEGVSVKKLSEEELNKFLLNNGMPIDKIKLLSLVHKYEIYKALTKLP